MNWLEHALALADQGLLIFPLRPRSKAPYSKEDFGGKGWKELMTTDADTIRGWFDTLSDMNYGVCGGPNFFIVDPDVDASQDKDGLKTFQELQALEDPTDMVYGVTFEVKSPRGGRHLYLKGSAACSVGTFATGIDVRGGVSGGEGYVVGPGSYTDADPDKNTAAGEYEVIGDNPIIDAPAWVTRRCMAAGLAKADASAPVVEWDNEHGLASAREIILQQTEWPTEHKGGDNATYHFCALMRDQAVSEEMCLEILNEAIYPDGASWNERCDPPWQESDLRKKIKHAYKYGKNAPGAKGGLLAEEQEYGIEFAEKAQREERVKQFARLAENTFTGGSLIHRVVQREMVIPEWLPMHGMTQVLAKRGGGKTILTLDLALRIATDMDWHGERVKGGLTSVYACGEDDLGLQELMKGWMHFHKVTPEADRFIAITTVPNLMDGEDVKSWVEYVKTILPEGQRCVFFLDTWQRGTSRASQNDEEQMQMSTDNAEALSKALGGAMVANFHPPKHNEGTISGSAVVENKGTAIWALGRDSDGFSRHLKVARMKGKGEGNEKRFRWQEVSWGEHDEFGNKRTGIVPVCDGGTSKEMSPETVQNRRTARSYYASIIEEIIIHHKDQGIRTNRGDFSYRDMARRIFKFMDVNPHSGRWKANLNSAQDLAWSSSENNLRLHLSRMFIPSDPAQETETGRHITYVSMGSNNGYFKIADELPEENAPSPKARSEADELAAEVAI